VESTIIQGRAFYIYIYIYIYPYKGLHYPLTARICEELETMQQLLSGGCTQLLYRKTCQPTVITNPKAFHIQITGYCTYIFMATLSHLSSTVWISIQLVSNLLLAATFINYVYNIARQAMYV